jgi:hypothetical protein
MEPRSLLATFVVTNTGDNGGVDPSPFAGTGTLRQAIVDSNATAGLNTIDFNITFTGSAAPPGPPVISPLASLPVVTNPVIIDGTSQPGYNPKEPTPQIELDGSKITTGTVNGLTITAGGSTVEGLVIGSFSGSGIELDSNGGDTILGNYIGTDPTGMIARSNLFNGITITCSGNTIGAINDLNPDGSPAVLRGNVISDNGNPNNTSFINNAGVAIQGPHASNNVVEGNFIGAGPDGQFSVGNFDSGVVLYSASNNTIGGLTPGARNIISNNVLDGIDIWQDQVNPGNGGSDGNTVENNYIGLDALGLESGSGNTRDGIEIIDSANNLIGGTTAAARNVIGSNGNATRGEGDGVFLSGAGATGNTVEGDFIGTDIHGTGSLSNTQQGVSIDSASNNIIGAVDALNPDGSVKTLYGNLISANAHAGVFVFSGDTDGSGNVIVASGNRIEGNFIGTDVTGTRGLGNSLSGVEIQSSGHNTVGGTSPGVGNLISANGGGIFIYGGANATGNVVQGNTIGTDVSGTKRLENLTNGVEIDASPVNLIGGTDPGAGNLISANGGGGVLIRSGGSSNVIQGNLIGTDRSGSQDLGNLLDGVQIFDGSNNLIGGPTASARNVISANEREGVEIDNADSTGNVVQGNYIGTDKTGTQLLGNFRHGVIIGSAPSNTIGGLTAVPGTGPGNLISGNDISGVDIDGQTASGNLVEGNAIGLSARGTLRLGNASDGVTISGAPGNTIGGTSAAARNVISGNVAAGVRIVGSGSTGNKVQGNYVGLDPTGRVDVRNIGDGVVINFSATNNTIGGPRATGAGNVISGNTGNGVHVSDGATRNSIEGNLIGTDATGAVAIGNAANGVFLDGVPGNVVGGVNTVPSSLTAGNGAGNVISGNSGNGVALNGGSIGDLIAGNLIGTNVFGVTAIGNAQSGLFFDHASNDTVGGMAPGAANVISGNHLSGLYLLDPQSTGNSLLNNKIGTNSAGDAALPNSGDGVLLTGAKGNLIGLPGAGNVISGNAADGIDIQGFQGASAAGNAIWANLIGLTAGGASALPNSGDGVALTATTGDVVGGTTPGSRNVISGNLGNGVRLSGSSFNSLLGNEVGTDAGGARPVPNGQDGFLLEGSPFDVIGGTAPHAGNVISGNTASGVELTAGTFATTVQGNFIGIAADGTHPLGNALGVFLNNAFGVFNGVAIGNTIGGDVPGASNVISGNSVAGIQILTANPNGVGDNVLGNLIGTDVTGKLAVGNNIGVFINNSSNDRIGGPLPGDGNVISGNVQAGVLIFGPTRSAGAGNAGIQGDLVQGNVIGPAVNLGVLGGSVSSVVIGVLVDNGPNDQVLGNLVGDNLVGVEVAGALSNGTTVAQCMITGNSFGVFINDAKSVTIGGNASAGNVIARNRSVGVEITGASASGNLVSGNRIDANYSPTLAAATEGVGVFVSQSTGNAIQDNPSISNNGLVGVYLFGVVPGPGAPANMVQRNTITNNIQYGVFLFNSAGNFFSVIQTGPSANRISGSRIANFREFTGPVPTAASARSLSARSAVSAVLTPRSTTRRGVSPVKPVSRR